MQYALLSKDKLLATVLSKYRNILDAVSGYEKQILKRHIKKVSPREVDHFTIVPNKLAQNLLNHKDLTAKHVFIACELAKMCWAQSKYCSLDALLTKKPIASRLGSSDAKERNAQ